MADQLASILRYATALTGDPALAEDVVQEALFRRNAGGGGWPGWTVPTCTSGGLSSTSTSGGGAGG